MAAMFGFGLLWLFGDVLYMRAADSSAWPLCRATRPRTAKDVGPSARLQLRLPRVVGMGWRAAPRAA